ncbi:MAG: NAD(P)-binding protein [Candidatus Binataceae bacterium]
MKTVLISGAGVAGLTIAYGLSRNGYAATVVERAPSFRLGGQPVDVRGPALTAVEPGNQPGPGGRLCAGRGTQKGGR